MRHELAHDLEVDVGLEQRQADLAHGRVDVFGSELAVAPQALHDALQAVGERIEHAPSLPCRVIARVRAPEARSRAPSPPAGARCASTERTGDLASNEVEYYS